MPASAPWHYDQIDASPVGLKLLKPHGSVNWCVQEQAEESKSWTEAGPCIVAPTHLKFVSHRSGDAADMGHGFIDRQVEVSRIWESMEREMRRAKALVFIGYSFPRQTCTSRLCFVPYLLIASPPLAW